MFDPLCDVVPLCLFGGSTVDWLDGWMDGWVVTTLRWYNDFFFRSERVTSNCHQTQSDGAFPSRHPVGLELELQGGLAVCNRDEQCNVGCIVGLPFSMQADTYLRY